MSAAMEITRNFLGGSDVAAVLGVSPYKTPFHLYMEKTGQYVEEITPKRQAIFDRGKRLEPYVMQWAAEDFGLEITAKNQRYYHPDYSFLSCEIDFEWRDDDGFVKPADIKTTSEWLRKSWGESGSDEIPVYYTSQFLFGQALTNTDLTLCIAMIGIDDLRPYRVRRDEELVKHIIDSCCEFWYRVQTRTPPPMTTLEDTKLAWSKDDGSQIEATSEIWEMVERIRLLRAGVKHCEDTIDGLALELQKFMGTATELVDSDGKKLVTWKHQQRKAYSVKESECRVFRLAGK